MINQTRRFIKSYLLLNSEEIRMKTRHPHLRCFVTWCKYWVRLWDDEPGEHLGGCGTYEMAIAATSGDKYPTCTAYKLHPDPAKQGIHGSLGSAKK